MLVLGSEHRSSCLYSKYFIHWAISQPYVWLFINHYPVSQSGGTISDFQKQCGRTLIPQHPNQPWKSPLDGFKGMHCFSFCFLLIARGHPYLILCYLLSILSLWIFYTLLKVNFVFLLPEINIFLLSLNTTLLLDKYLPCYKKLSLNPLLASFETYMHWNIL